MKLLKLEPLLIKQVEKERLTFLFMPKGSIEQGAQVELIAYGKDEVDGYVGYMRPVKMLASQQIHWTSTVSGWSGRCSIDTKPLTVAEAYKLLVSVLKVISAEKFNALDAEKMTEYLYDYELAEIKKKVLAEFGTEKLPVTHEILFVAVMTKGKR